MERLDDTQISSVIDMLKSKDKSDVILAFEYLNIIYFQDLPLRTLKRIYKVIATISPERKRNDFEHERVNNVNRFRRLWMNKRDKIINEHFEKVKNKDE